MSSTRRLLFERFPELRQKLPWMELAELPTPVEPLEQLGQRLGRGDLWIKRDDWNSTLYSGNKVRKFEFLFARAEQLGCREILSMGGVGSNHGAATSLFCRHLGFESVLALMPQPVLSYVRQNIRINHECGARQLLAASEVHCVAKAVRYAWSQRRRGRPSPYVMYFGGSWPRGTVGFIEAGLELAAQVRAGELPEPRYVFVAAGSCGTQAGLIIGLRLAGLATEVVGVRVVPKLVTNRFVVAAHVNATAQWLRRLAPSFPPLWVAPSEIEVLGGYCGGQYGRPTATGKAAMGLLEDTEGLKLDPTYTGKAFAGMLARLAEPCAGPVLFWQTLNSVDLSRWAQGVPADLPDELRRYFTEPLADPEL